MKVISYFSIVVLAVMALTAQAQPVPNEYIIVLQNNVNPGAMAQEIAVRHGAIPAHVFSSAINGIAAKLPPGLAARLATDPRIRYIEPNQVYLANGVPKDVGSQGKPSAKPTKKPKPTPDPDPTPTPTPSPDDTLPTGIDRVDAEGLSNLNGDVTIAIIDSGVDLDHSDLNVADFGYVYFDLPNADDDHGHGTHVAGTAAAMKNGYGVVGVAPGATIVPVKVLDSTGSGDTFSVVAGMEWVRVNADIIDVANMSLGGGYSTAINDAVANLVNAGVVVVVSAGNSAKDASNYSPASAPGAITVSAINDLDGQPGGLGGYIRNRQYKYYDDTFAWFSNFGAVVDIAAPGVNILSTYYGDRYATMSGTSMASPHVAGAAALVIFNNDALSVQEVRNALVTNSVPQGSSEGFTGDPDNDPEPLLNVGGF